LVAWQRWVAWAALCITCGGLRDVAVRMSCLTVIIACLSFTIAWCGCEDELCSTLRAFCSSLRGVAVRLSCVQHCVPFVHHCVVWLWGRALPYIHRFEKGGVLLWRGIMKDRGVNDVSMLKYRHHALKKASEPTNSSVPCHVFTTLVALF
jgi:hypothetical protein